MGRLSEAGPTPPKAREEPLAYVATQSKNAGSCIGVDNFGANVIESSGTANLGGLKVAGTQIPAAAPNTYTQTYSTANRTVANPTATALTDSTTGAVGATLAAGAGVYTLAFYIDAATIADGDLLTTYVPGHKFKILKFDARCAKAVTTGAKASTLNLEIETTNVTGGAVALSGTYALGAAQAGTAITAANTGTSAQSFSIEASSTTTFVEGAFWLLVSIQNMDTADALAALADGVNKLIADDLDNRQTATALIDDLQTVGIVL